VTEQLAMIHIMGMLESGNRGCCMKTSIIISSALIIMLSLPGCSSHVGAVPSAQDIQSPTSQSQESPLPVYTPRNKTIPRARVGGNLRGTEGKDPEIVALVPDHVGLTVKQAPSLN